MPPHSAVHNTFADFLAASITPSQPYPISSFLSLCLSLVSLTRPHLDPLCPNQVDPQTCRSWQNEFTNTAYGVCSFPAKLNFSRLSSYVSCYEGVILLILISTVKFIVLKVYVDTHTHMIFFSMKCSFLFCSIRFKNACKPTVSESALLLQVSTS